MILRRIGPADTAFLWEMLHAAIYVPAGAEPFPKRFVQDDPTLARYAAAFGARVGDIGWLAEGSGTPLGAAWVRLFPPHAPGFGYVDEITPELSIAVSATHRGQGVGTALLAKLLETCATPVSLSCDPANPAWRLYERFGFVAVSERTMVYRLPGAPPSARAGR